MTDVSPLPVMEEFPPLVPFSVPMLDEPAPPAPTVIAYVTVELALIDVD
jgi:hypothetical protein